MERDRQSTNTCSLIGRFGRNMTLSKAIRRLIAEDPRFRDLLEDYSTLLAELVETSDIVDSKARCEREGLLELRAALEDEILENLKRVLPEMIDDRTE